MIRNNKAFTLIELVMVIVILGILAAAAIPKFADFRSKAYEAAVNGVVGSVQAGISIFRANALVNDSYTNPPAESTGWPTDLDDSSPGLGLPNNPLFDYVLDQGGITDGNWNKISGGGAPSSYAYVANDSGSNIYDYTNSDGRFVKKQ